MTDCDALVVLATVLNLNIVIKDVRSLRCEFEIRAQSQHSLLFCSYSLVSTAEFARPLVGNMQLQVPSWNKCYCIWCVMFTLSSSTL